VGRILFERVAALIHMSCPIGTTFAEQSLQEVVKIERGFPVPQPTHPRAVKRGPSSTSSRFVMVSTNQLWRAHVNCAWSDDHAGYRKLQNALQKLNPRHTGNARAGLFQWNQIRLEIFSLLHIWAFSCTPHLGTCLCHVTESRDVN
jgi:hypothetical protein